MPNAFTIRPEQMRALVAPALARLSAAIIEDLLERKVASACAIPRPLLERRVSWGLHVAQDDHGLREEGSIRVFVNLLFEIAPGLPAHPRAAQLLGERRASDRERIRALLSWLNDPAWLTSAAELGEGTWPCG